MVVLDAYALIAFTKDEPCADVVADFLRDSTVMCAVNFAEVVDHLLRVARMEHEWIDVHFAPIINQGLNVLAADAAMAERAAAVRAEHYRSKAQAISLADSFAIATAVTLDAPLATSDPALAAVLRDIDQPLIPLPDSRGRLP